MPDINWVQVGISFFVGSAFATLLKIGYDQWIARRQPVSYRISTDSVFSSVPHAGALQAQAQVTHDGHAFPFDALSLVRIEMRNKGNRDIDRFPFGITLADGHVAVLSIIEGEDRHHQITEVEPRATPRARKEGVDLVCSPFNRGDQYTIRLYVQNKGAVKPEQVKLSTAIPIRFSRVQSVDEQSPRQSSAWFFGVICGIAGFAVIIAMILAWNSPHRRVIEEERPDGSVIREEVDRFGQVRERFIVPKEQVDKEAREYRREQLERLKKEFEPEQSQTPQSGPSK